MHYAILAYHAEGVVESWSEQEDDALMDELLAVNDRLVAEKHLGPAARLGPTADARTLRGPGDGMVIDGPFAETKEQLGGYHVIECGNLDDAIAIARRIPTIPHGGTVEVRPLEEVW